MGKILIIRGGAVGDFILTLPAIQALRESLPNAEIEVLGYDSITSIAIASGLAHGTKSMEYGPLSAFFVPNGDLPSDLVDYFASFSVVVSYLYDPDEYFHTNLEKAGVETLLRGPYQIDESTGTHAATQLVSPLENLAIYPDSESRSVSLTFDAATQSAAKAQLTDVSSPTIAIHPGSGSPRKNWSFEGWILALTAIHREQPSARFVVISGEAEYETISSFYDLMESAALPFQKIEGQTLPVVGAVIQHCDLFLGHDTGISHLAGICGTQSLLLFGPTDPEIWSPPHPFVSVVQAEQQDLSLISSKAIAEKALRMLEDFRVIPKGI